jgi:hypothetical protein|tara:strand:+ start:557 stop:778 length:222 start_codon:yes stop_codon:yes gene_type:complete
MEELEKRLANALLDNLDLVSRQGHRIRDLHYNIDFYKSQNRQLKKVNNKQVQELLLLQQEIKRLREPKIKTIN